MSLIKKPFELKVQPSIKVLIYGQPGLRKTTFALSAPAPLLLDFDGGVHRVDPRHQSDTVQIEKWDDIADLLKEDLSSYKTLIIDTAGKMLDYMSTHLVLQDAKLGKRDGSLSLQGYGVRKTMFQNFLKQVALLGKHLVFVAHEKEEREGDQKIIRPEIGGSSAGDLIKELDLVGYLQSIGQKKTISFEPCEKFYGKNTCKLAPVIDLQSTLEENKPNTQLTSIFDTYQKSLEERKQVATEYTKLMADISEKVEHISTPDSANEVSEWAKAFEGHIWDSKLQAALSINKKTKELGLVINKESKKYEMPAAVAPEKKEAEVKQPVTETAPAAKTEIDSKPKTGKSNAQKQPELIG